MSRQDSAASAGPRSYWHETAGTIVPSDPFPAQSDVVVVGGGLLGCWTAYWLARSGVAVTLLEQTAIAWGATGRNGGFVVAGTAAGYADNINLLGRDAARDLWRLTEDGKSLVGQIVAEENIDCDYRTTGTISLALTTDTLDEQRRNQKLLREDRFSREVLDRQGVQELVGTPLSPEIAGGLFTPDGALLHSSRYLAGVAGAARRLGARLCQAEATALIAEPDHTRIETTSGPIRASRVVVAVNAWTDVLLPGLAGLVVPVRGQVIAYEPLPPVFRAGLGAPVTSTGEYWQQALDGTIIIGGCRADAPNGDVGIRDLSPTPGVTAALEGVLPRLFPELRGLRVARRWAGPMAFTADYLPVADAAPDLPGVWVTGGFSGHGMPYGPRVGQLLAEAATTGVTPAALSPLALTRPSLTSLTASH